MVKCRELSLEERVEIGTLVKSGKSYRAVAREKGIHHSTVLRIHKSFIKKKSYEKGKRSGRKSLLSTDLSTKIEKEIEKSPTITSSELKKILAPGAGPCESSLRNYRRSLGYSSSKGKPQDILTERHKVERKDYCESHKRDKFSNVLFTDEKPFELFKARRKVWRKRGSPVVHRITTKYPPKIQVWGGISKMGKTDLVIWYKRGWECLSISTKDQRPH